MRDRRKPSDERAVAEKALQTAAELLKRELTAGGSRAKQAPAPTLAPLLRQVGEFEQTLVDSGELLPGDAAVIIDYAWGDCEESAKLRRALLQRCLHAERENERLRARLRDVDAMLASLSKNVAAPESTR